LNGVVFAHEADPGTSMRLSPGLRVTLKDMALAKLHCRHPVVHLLLGLCQTTSVICMPGTLTLTPLVTWLWPAYCLIGAPNDSVICGVTCSVAFGCEAFDGNML